MIRKIIIIVFFLLLFAPKIVTANTTEKTSIPQEAPPAPTLIFPDSSFKTSKVKPVITGLSVNNTAVYIYIDGVYNGKTEILKHDSGTANFAYLPFLNLSVGKHKVWAVSKNNNGSKSNISNILEFTIEEHFPAPTLKQVIKNKKRPVITGLAKNESIVKIFIDHKLYSEFKIKDHKSGTANFSYIPNLDLTEGDHLIYTTAIDQNGKESPWSNMLSIKIGELKPKPQISETAATEDALSNENSELYYNNIENLIKSTEKELKKASGEEYNKTSSSSVDDIDNTKINESGVFDETNIKRSIWHSSIFVLFIVMIIGWVLWVNKEDIDDHKN